MEKQSLPNQTTQSGSIIPKEVTWYYVFTWGEEHVIPRYQRWVMAIVDRFSKKSLPTTPTHVFAFAEMGSGLQFVEPTRSQLILSYKFDETGGVFKASHAIDCLKEKDCVVVKSTHKPNLSSWRHLLSWMPTCVSAIKITTNYPSLAITPNNLYNSLIKRYNNTLSKGE